MTPPNYTPAQDNGWDNVYTSTCSGKVKTPFVAAALDRADLNGYASYLTAHSHFTPGVYSSPSVWDSHLRHRQRLAIPTTYEWTYTADTSSSRHPPAAGACRARPPAPGSSAG